MKTKKVEKKLGINKLTISNLEIVQQELIKGGTNLTDGAQCPEPPPFSGHPCRSEYICL